MDILALIRQLWEGRKTVIICTVVFMVLGFVAALTMKRTYSVSTIMVPQMNSGKSSSLNSLASLAGFDLGMANSSADLSPLAYPKIVSSTPFQLELIYTPVHYAKVDHPVSMYTYFKEYTKPSVMGVIKKYTIGLPFTILGALQKEKPEITLPGGEGDDSPKPLVLSKDEEKLLKAIAPKVTLAVDKKEGYITLSVTGSEAIQTAELAMKAQQLLSDEVIRFRTEKSQNELDYIQARYDEIKKEAESYQSLMATVSDRSQNMLTSKSKIEMERIRSKYTVANSVYAEMAKQLEQAKMQVKKDTPVFTILQPVVLPTKPANSRAKTLIVWTFMGIILGAGLVLGKDYWSKFKTQFQKTESVQ
jgi:LPS O-antigen subunit length determinant protein (WzzB/FepE family)